DEKIVKVVLRKVPDRPGIAARVLRALADQNIKIDTIIQSMRSGKVNDMAFIIPSGDLEKIDLERLKIRSEAEDIIVEDNIAKLSLVGINVTSSPEIPAILFETLASEGINIDMISTSNSRISVIISRDSIKEAVRIVHDRFNLG
ncbi:MAG: aspartate kinase, partial [Thermotoga sp.]